MNTPQLLVAEEQYQELGLLHAKSYLRIASLAALFIIAAVIRLYPIEAPGILVEREYTSAIFARVFYFAHNDSVPDWRKHIATTLKDNQPILEPPVNEYLVSLIYRAVGEEKLVYARYLTSAFWLVGGIFFFAIVRRLLSADAALASTAYYLLVPLGINVSRSFQPDSLMVMLFLVSLFCILRYFDRPSLSWLLLAAGISGLTLLIRPLVLFAIFGAFIALAIFQVDRSRRMSLIGRPLLIFTVVSLLPSFAYYGYGILVAGYMRWKVDSSFRPYLYVLKVFWRDWFLLGVNAAGFTTLIAALLGAPLLRGMARVLALGLFVGYIIFGLVFTYHIDTHEYYHVQLIPIIALCIAPLVMLIVRRLRQELPSTWWLPAMAALLIALYFVIREVRDAQQAPMFESVQTAREIGEIVQHSDRTVFLARHYGLPLEYYGELSGIYWPRANIYRLHTKPIELQRSVEARFAMLGITPDYFIITDFKEFDTHHADLKVFLREHGTLIAQTDTYLIYRLSMSGRQ